MGPSQKFLDRVGSATSGSGKFHPKNFPIFNFILYGVIQTSDGTGTIFVAWVGSGQPPLLWVWVRNISPENHKILRFFPYRIRKNLGSGQGPTLIRLDANKYLYSIDNHSHDWINERP